MEEGLNPFSGVPVQSHCRSSAFGKAFAGMGEVGEVLPSWCVCCQTFFLLKVHKQLLR